MARTPSSFSAADFGWAGGLSGMDMGVATPAQAKTPVEEKAAQVEQASMLKRALYGTPDEQRVLATALIQGNELANNQELRDIYELDATSFAHRYGADAERDRHLFTNAVREVRRLKERERSGEQVLGDTLVDAGLAAVNVAGAVGGAVTGAYDAINPVPGAQPLSPILSQGLNWVNDQGRALQSDLMQERRIQHAIEGELMAQDSAAQYDRDQADLETARWSGVRQFGRDARDAALNYADDPIMAGSLVPEAVGSLLPQTAMIRTIAAARVAGSGLSGVAARQALEAEAVRLAPVIMGLTEGGSALTQAQQQILSLSEQDLSGNEQYQELRAQNMGHEEAQFQLAKTAGITAGITAVPGAFIAGHIAAPIAANPLAVRATGRGLGSTAVGAGRNILKEGVEEAIQEGNTQVASNIGLNAAGQETDLTDGVAQSAVQGALGGVAAGGTLQAPGTAIGTTGEALRLLGRGLGAAVDGRVSQVNRLIDAEDTSNGTAARQETFAKAKETGDQILQTVRGDGSTPPRTEAETKIATSIEKALYVPADEVQGYAESFPVLKERLNAAPDRPLERAETIRASEEILLAEGVPEEARLMVAVGLLSSLDEMRSVESTETRKAIDELGAENQISKGYEQLTQQLRDLESSPGFKTAEAILKSVTAEQIGAILPVEELKAGTAAPEIVAASAQVLSKVASYNAAVVDPELLGAVLNQVGNNPILKKSLEVSKKIAEEFIAADQAREKISQTQKTEIEALPQDKQGRYRSAQHDTVDLVREDIALGGNARNRMPSLVEHRRLFGDAVAAGRNDLALRQIRELRNFGRSMANKVAALNMSASDGQASWVQYQAYGPYKFFDNDRGVRVFRNSPNSRAFARETWLDAQSIATLHNTLLQAYGPSLGLSAKQVKDGQLKVEDLHNSITLTGLKQQTPKAATQNKPAPAPVAEPVAEPVNQEEVLEEDIDVIDEGDAAPAPETAPPPAASDTAPDPVAGTEEQEQTDAAAETPAPEIVDESDVVEDDESPVKEIPWLQSFKDRAIKGVEGVNYFLKSFKPTKTGSLLVQHIYPASWMLENIDKLVSDENGLDRELNDEQKALLKTILGKAFPSYAKRFNDRVEKALELRKDWRTNLENGTKDVLAYNNALPLNFLTEGEGGTMEIEQEVLDATFMAVLEYVMRAAGRHQKVLDDEDVAKAWGLPRTARVSQDMRDVVESGTNVQTALDEIGDRIQTLLGVRADRNASVTFSQGMMKAMASNALLILAEDGLIEINRPAHAIEVDPTPDNPSGKRTMTTVSIPQASRDKLKPLVPVSDIFTRVFTKSDELERYVGKPPEMVAGTQLKNRFGKLSKKERAMVERLQNTPHYINTPLLGFFESLGGEALLKVLGYQDTSKMKLNVLHKKSIEGRNRAIISGIENVNAYADAAEAQSSDKYRGTVPIFFPWRISRVGRAQQQGPGTPQGDKYTRELITATNAVIDLTDKREADAAWLAVAQSIGVKVEKKAHQKSIDEAKAMMDGELAQAVAIAESWLKDGELKPEQAKAFAESLAGQDVTPKLLHAVMTVARMNQAIDKGGEATSKFAVSLALEADGKTDGPINAMFHMMTDFFDARQLRRLAKGGFFVGKQRMSLNDYIAMDPDDLYTEAARAFEIRLDDLIGGLEGEELVHASSVVTVLNALLPDFDLIPNDDAVEFSVGRNVVKNPLTVFLYGSGVNGIARKIAGAALDEFYKAMSQLAETGGKWQDLPVFKDNPGLVQHLDRLLNTQISTSKDGMGFARDNQASLKSFLARPEDAQVRAQAFDNLSAAIEHFFAEPMSEAIDEVTGGLASKMRDTQTAAQIQATVFQDTFQRLLAEKEAELKASGEITGQRQISEAEVAKVFEAAMKVAPIYETDAQSFHISSGERYGSDKKVSEALPTGKEKQTLLSSKATLPHPTEAGVKISPYLTIGTGDGRMILNIYVDGDGSLSTSLPVFDGVELSVDSIYAGSEQINKAVYDAWMLDSTYQLAADGLARMLPNLKLGDLSEEAIKQIRRSLGLGKEDPLTNDTLTGFQAYMQGLANESRARKLALNRMHNWTDHMGSAMAPHENSGESVDADLIDLDGYFDAAAEKLNTFYAEELAKIEAEQGIKAKVPEVQAPSRPMKAMIRRLGSKVEGHDVTMMQGGALKGLFQELTGSSKDQGHVFRDLLGKDGALKGATIFFGTQEALEKLRDEQFGDAPKAPIQRGQYLPGYNVIFVVNHAPETVLHELLHAYTYKTLVNHYQDPESSPEHVKEAVGRLEKLANEVWAMNPHTIPHHPTAAALATLQGEMKAIKDKPQRMSEFLSWMLSNQNLIELGKDQKVYDPILRILRSALDALKTLLGLRNRPGNTLFSNIRFNTEILISEVSQAKIDTEVKAVLDQVYGTDPRLEQIEQQFLNKLERHLATLRSQAKDLADQTALAKKVDKLRENARAAADHLVQNGFGLSPRQKLAFETIHVTMQIGAELDATAMKEANRLYGHVVRNLKPENFLIGDGPFTPSEIRNGMEQYKAITGNAGIRQKANGRTDLLATFVAIAQTDDSFRAVLENMAPPKDVEIDRGSVDGFVNSLLGSIWNLFSRFNSARLRQSTSAQEAIDVLSTSLSQIKEQHRFLALALRHEIMEKANTFLSAAVQKGSDKAYTFLTQAADRQVGNSIPRKLARTSLRLSASVAALGSKEASAAVGEAMTTMMNHAPNMHTFRELLNDIRGATQSNLPLMRLINPVKAQIDADRQDYRENVPAELQSHFSRTLKREEWGQLFQGIARTDLVSLGLEGALELLGDPATVQKKIQDAKAEIQKLMPKWAGRYDVKAKALAIYMMGGDPNTNNLLRNASAIAHLYGEKGPKAADVTPELVDAIDRLTSLYAFDLLEQGDKDGLKTLAEGEAKGMKILAGYQAATRENEMKKLKLLPGNALAHFNGWKGYIPSTIHEGHTVIVADDSENATLVKKGFTRIGDYRGDMLEGYRGKRGYYQSTVAGKNAFRQGIAQTVHATFMGVDTRTGQTREGDTAGMIIGTEAEDIAKARTRILDNRPSGEYLLPIYDTNGQVVAWEQSMKRDMLKGLQRDDHLGRMLGVWSGRIIEEDKARQYNEALLGTLKEIWENERNTLRSSEYVNVVKSKDPVMKDAWNTLGWEFKEAAAEVFGQENFLPVRLDMWNDAMGYRAAGVTDAWTGTSRWSKENQERFRDLATLFFGKNAYKWLSQAEGFIEEGVSIAKTNIVVRSVIVSAGNMISNILHLMTHGIDPITLYKGTRDKLTEVHEYTANRREILSLKVELASEKPGSFEANRIEAQISALEDANAALSIQPLIQAGEFSTVSENLTEADVAIREGKLGELFEKLAEKIPGPVKTVGKNLFITKDTALFQALNRSVQYGDFVAKAVLYDHLIAKGKSKEQVLDLLFEEFVPYNRLAGRARDFAEGVGLLWFWNYKLRIQKIAVNMLRDRPLTALLYGHGLGPSLDIDTVFSGSLAGKIAEGTLGYSVGPEMGYESIWLNPFLSPFK